MSMSGKNPITTAIWEAQIIKGIKTQPNKEPNKDEESKCCFTVLLEKNYWT